MINRSKVPLAFLCILATPAQAANHELIPGPVRAQLIRVVDGDTVLVDASPWPQQRVTTYVRLRGIDAPEMHAPCAPVREDAARASAALEQLLKASEALYLFEISGDKYFGRVVADIHLDDGRSASAVLIEGAFARAYDGGRKPESRCAP